MLVDRSLRSRIRFQQANLTQPLPDLGQFDIIFLRNVLIYFDDAGKRDIVQRVLTRLRRGGLLFTGHAESSPTCSCPSAWSSPPFMRHRLTPLSVIPGLARLTPPRRRDRAASRTALFRAS